MPSANFDGVSGGGAINCSKPRVLRLDNAPPRGSDRSRFRRGALAGAEGGVATSCPSREPASGAPSDGTADKDGVAAVLRSGAATGVFSLRVDSGGTLAGEVATAWTGTGVGLGTDADAGVGAGAGTGTGTGGASTTCAGTGTDAGAGAGAASGMTGLT